MSELVKRISVAAIGIPLALAVIYIGNILFSVAVVGISAFALYEFYGIAEKKSITTSKHFGLLAGILLQIIIISLIDSTSFQSTMILLSAFLIFIFLIFIDTLFAGKNFPLLSFSATIAGIIYIPLMLSALIALREFNKISDLFSSYNESGIFVLLVFSAVWVCDSAAYFYGKKYGKHKLFPRVSPKKSWEGAIAGLISSVLYASAVTHFTGILPIYHGAIIGIIAAVFGHLGDLFESILKRDAGIKDSSNILPGHGGILDRFDSIIFVAPFALIYLIVITQI